MGFPHTSKNTTNINTKILSLLNLVLATISTEKMMFQWIDLAIHLQTSHVALLVSQQRCAPSSLAQLIEDAGTSSKIKSGHFE